jgi:hypothetical protein
MVREAGDALARVAPKAKILLMAEAELLLVRAL